MVKKLWTNVTVKFRKWALTTDLLTNSWSIYKKSLHELGFELPPTCVRFDTSGSISKPPKIFEGNKEGSSKEMSISALWFS
jgi:hypothetical protein